MTGDGRISDRTWEMLMVELGDIKDGQKEIMTLVRKQNGRIGKLEQWRSWIMGAIGILAVLLGVAIKYLT